MAATQEALRDIEVKVSILRGLVGKKAIADAGKFSYQNPLTGVSVEAAIAPAAKTNAVNAYKAALADLKAAVAALKE